MSKMSEEEYQNQMRAALREQCVELGLGGIALQETVDLAMHAAEEAYTKFIEVCKRASGREAQGAAIFTGMAVLDSILDVRLKEMRPMIIMLKVAVMARKCQEEEEKARGTQHGPH